MADIKSDGKKLFGTIELEDWEQASEETEKELSNGKEDGESEQ